MDLLPRPSLRDEDVIAMRCGIRPHRRGRVRVEREDVFGKVVVHNYGHGGAGVTLSWGTAAAAADLARARVTPGGRAAILGAGVVGLTTAHELARAGWTVRIYAREVAHQTTSALAGALWLPTGVSWGQTEAERQRFLGWLRVAKARFCEQGRQGGWGVRELPLWEPGTDWQDPRFFRDGIVTDRREVARLPIHGPPRAGLCWTGLYIDTPVFLDRLLAELRTAGVTIAERSFASAQEIGGLDEPVVVNCLGLGARGVWRDDAMVPVRGHLVHMRPQALGYIFHGNYTYMFPRASALVLGGSYEEGIDDPRVDESICRGILAKHRAAHGL